MNSEFIIKLSARFSRLRRFGEKIAASRFTKKAALAAATGFGLGLSPFASGTAGALLGIPLILCLAGAWAGSIAWQIFWCVILTAAAVPLCDVAEKHFKQKDDRRIVADEYLTFPIGLVGLPICIPSLVMAFITNRIFDILKPPPANWAQEIPGGTGIVADDAISALYSLALNHIIFSLFMTNMPPP
jgi:phosphatidylglycerophosphatase A